MYSSPLRFPGSLSILVLQVSLNYAAVLQQRKGGGGDSDDDSADKPSSPLPSSLSSSSPTPTSATALEAKESGGENHGSPTISSTSANPSMTGLAQTLSSKTSFTGGKIAGVAIGGFIALGLLMMILSRLYSRRRRALKRPRGFVPQSFLENSVTPTPPHGEMSEARPSGLLSSAPFLAAVEPITSRSSPHVLANVHPSPYSPTSPTSPTSPNVLTDIPHTNRQSSISRSALHSDSTSDTDTLPREPMQSLPGTNLLSTAPPMWAAAPQRSTDLLKGSSSAAGTSETQSTLHSDMEAYQKALEMDNEKRSQDPANDPPPNYSD